MSCARCSRDLLPFGRSHLTSLGSTTPSLTEEGGALRVLEDSVLLEVSAPSFADRGEDGAGVSGAGVATSASTPTLSHHAPPNTILKSVSGSATPLTYSSSAAPSTMAQRTACKHTRRTAAEVSKRAAE